MNNSNTKSKQENKNETTTNKSKAIKVNDYFKLPIYYNKEKRALKENVKTDLELVESVDPSCNPILSFVFNTDSNNDNNNNNKLSKILISQTAEYYTTDIGFLKDNQQLLKKYISPETKYTQYSPNYESILKIWDEIKNDNGFKEKYYFLDWDMLECLNHSELFLQVMSIYNMSSPIISLFIPVILCIIPFLIIKLKGLKVTFSEYIIVLKQVIKTNAIGKLFTSFSAATLQEQIYLIVSAAFYLFSIYQNAMVCIRFNNNMIKIHNYFNEIKHYLSYTISSMENYLQYSDTLVSHTDFNNNLKDKIVVLKQFYDNIESISEYKITNLKKISEIGYIMKQFYELYQSQTLNDTFLYSFGFNGYIDCLEGLQKNIEERKLNFTNFTNSTKTMVIKNNYYACLKDAQPVKNDVQFKKNLIITGPNASGKTTILKSTLINIFISQQFGCGFYDSANLQPFHHIHCYLNIPDTSGRDSLFQAEARRCKEILDVINNNNHETHFCVFDELYSGTNPDEAVDSAKSFMEYIVKNKNVSCMLTTHFVKVCKKLKKNVRITNYHMDTEKINQKLNYKYKLKPGISEIKGGFSVLTEMNYPKEILENATYK